MEQLTIKTNKKVGFIDITSNIKDIISRRDVMSGLIHIYVPHTTAAVTINEGADPSVKKDIIKELNKIIPFKDNYSHLEGNSAAHIKSSVIGCSEQIMVDQGKLILGRWQSIFFCEFDGPRSRKINIKLIES